MALAVLVLAAGAAPAHAGGDFMGVAGGGRAVWVTGSFGLVRLDPETGRIARQYVLPVVYPLAAARANGAIWVASVENGYTSGTVTRIDLRTGAARTVFRRERWPAQAVAVTGSTVWVSFGSRLGRFDAAGRLVGVTPVDPDGGWLAADAGGAWFCCHARRLLRIDPTGRRHASFTLPTADPLWSGLGSLWLDDLTTLDRIDPQNGRVVARIPLRSVTSMAFAAGSVYALQDGAIARLDPATNRILLRRPLAGVTQSVAVTPSGVWVTSVRRTQPSQRVFRLNPRTLATELTIAVP